MEPKPGEKMTFEQFIETLKELEAHGLIEVIKWPAHEHDPLEARLLKPNEMLS